MEQQGTPDQTNTWLAHVVVGLAVCVLLTAGVTAYLWIRSTWYPARELVFVSGELEDNLDLYTADQYGRRRKRLTNSPEYELFPTWSPDGKRLAFVRTTTLGEPGGEEDWDRAGIYVMTLHGMGSPKEELLASAEDVGIGVPSWSPDGQRIALLSIAPSSTQKRRPDSILTLIDVEIRARVTVPLTVTVGTMDRALTWSPDGTVLAFAASEEADGSEGPDAPRTWGCVYDLGHRTLRYLVPHASTIVWSPRGDLVACQITGEGGRVSLVRPSGAVERSLGDGGWVSDLAWSPDGTHLAVARETEASFSEITLFSVDDGTVRVFPSEVEGMIQFLAWSQDGGYLAYSLISMDLDEQLVSTLWVIDVQEGDESSFPRVQGIDAMPAWRPVVSAGPPPENIAIGK